MTLSLGCSVADPKSPPDFGASVLVSPPNKPPDLGASFVSVVDPKRPPVFGAEPNGEAVDVVVALPNNPDFGV